MQLRIALLATTLCAAVTSGMVLRAEGGTRIKRDSQPQDNGITCPVLPASDCVPTSVHRLRPADVKVIGAMGDSLTAGNGAKATNFLETRIQNRGLSWSGGGQTYEDHITMPNLIKWYNHAVYGYAIGDGTEDSPNSKFNVAVSGSTSGNLPSQALELVERMKNDSAVDIDNDWKVITILTGNNDLCAYCLPSFNFSADIYKDNLQNALEILKSELPRTLVNLVGPVNMKILREFDDPGPVCSAFHKHVCSCVASPAENDAALQDLFAVGDRMQEAAEEIAESGRYDTSDFTVVAQPFLKETHAPRFENNSVDMSWFAPDCFHLSLKGHKAAGIALWNNMLSVPSEKQLTWATDGVIKCPTEEHPFFYTHNNTDQ